MKHAWALVLASLVPLASPPMGLGQDSPDAAEFLIPEEPVAAGPGGFVHMVGTEASWHLLFISRESGRARCIATLQRRAEPEFLEIYFPEEETMWPLWREPRCYERRQFPNFQTSGLWGVLGGDRWVHLLSWRLVDANRDLEFVLKRFSLEDGTLESETVLPITRAGMFSLASALGFLLPKLERPAPGALVRVEGGVEFLGKRFDLPE